MSDTSRSTSPIDSFPFERFPTTSLFVKLDIPILDQIASFLDFRSALNLSTVCKRVRNSAERELWRMVDIEQPLVPLYQREIRDTGCRTELDALAFYKEIFHKYPIRATFVKTIHASWIHPSRVSINLDRILATFPLLPNLREIRIKITDDSGLVSLLQGLVNLAPSAQSLKIHSDSRSESRVNPVLMPVAAQIAEIRIKGWEQAVVHVMRSLFPNSLPALRSIVIECFNAGIGIKTCLQSYFDARKPSIQHLGLPIDSFLEHPCLHDLHTMEITSFGASEWSEEPLLPDNLFVIPQYPNLRHIIYWSFNRLVQAWKAPAISQDTYPLSSSLVMSLSDSSGLTIIRQSAYRSISDQKLSITSFRHDGLDQELLHVQLSFWHRREGMKRDVNMFDYEQYRRYYVDYRGRCLPTEVLRFVYETAQLDFDDPPIGRSLTLCDEAWSILETWYHDQRMTAGSVEDIAT